MTKLTQQQIEDLQDEIDANDISAYYALLESYGDNYGRLGGAVTDNDSWQGELANGFAAHAAEDNSVDLSYGSTAWNNLNKAIAQGYLDAYKVNNGQTPSWDEVQDIHNTEYQLAGIDTDDWIPNKLLNDSADPASLWNDYLVNDGAGDLLEDAVDVVTGPGRMLFGPYLFYKGVTDGELDQSDVDFARALLNGLGNMSDSARSDMTNDFNPLKDVGEMLNEIPQGARNVMDDYGWGLGNPGSVLKQLLPNWLLSPKDKFDDSKESSSPLVVDADGDGTIELATFDAQTTSTFFDLDNDGFAEQTAWVSSDDALLARDVDGNGTIDDASELFGSATVDGFAKLAELDSNGDQVIDQYDSAWSELVLWQDSNSDAVTQNGELSGLSAWNIESIDLAGVVSSSETNSGNRISHESTVTYSDGTAGKIVDAWFTHDQVNSVYAADYTLDIRSVFLPTLRGFGNVKPLNVTTSEDMTLLGLVKQFVVDWSHDRFSDTEDLDADIEAIMYRWAGVDGVATDSRGPHIDARKLEFLEEMFGEEWLQRSLYSDPQGGAAAELEEAFALMHENIRAQLIVQADGAAIFDGTAEYDVFAGELTGNMDLDQSTITAMETNATATGVDTEAYWVNVARFLRYSKGFTNFTTQEDQMMDTAISNTDPSLSWADIKAYADPAVQGADIDGTSGDDTLQGTIFSEDIYAYGGDDTVTADLGDDYIYGAAGADTLYGGGDDDEIIGGADGDSLYGEEGNDILEGDDGNDLLYGGSGNDVLKGENGADTLDDGVGGDTVYGGAGDDIYVFTGGDDLYDEDSGGSSNDSDTIKLPSGITLQDINLLRIEDDSTGDSPLFIEVGDLGVIETPFFYYGSSLLSTRIETLTFADLSTYDLDSFTELDTYGTEGDDYINAVTTSQTVDNYMYGLDGNDELIGSGGDDILDGGLGNDKLFGNAGDDTFIASPGFDEVTGSGGTDVIELPDGVTADDVSFLRLVADDDRALLISIKDLGQTLVNSQYNYQSGAYAVETLKLYDQTTIDILASSVESRGDEANNYISGINSGGSQDDIIDGRGGDDTLNGGSGDDVYYFSAGIDDIQENGGTDTVRFRDGYDPGDVEIYRAKGSSSWDYLVLEDSAGNKIRAEQFENSTPNKAIEHVEFTDSTVWNVFSMEIEARGTSGNDYLYGFEYGDASPNDTIYGYGGDDDLYGNNGDDVLYGGDGDDTLEGGDDNDTLYGGKGIDLVYGEDGNDTLYGDAGTDTLEGGLGDDILYGGSGNDTLKGDRFSYQLGNDELHGGDGNDTIIGRGGNDLIDGGDGQDTLYGGGGDDTFIFYSASAYNNVDTIDDFDISSESDALELSDLLTQYDPLTDVITDFVQITDNGSDSTVSVDADGGADNFTSIALLESITGLTDEASLQNNGHLITA